MAISIFDYSPLVLDHVKCKKRNIFVPYRYIKVTEPALGRFLQTHPDVQEAFSQAKKLIDNSIFKDKIYCEMFICSCYAHLIVRIVDSLHCLNFVRAYSGLYCKLLFQIEFVKTPIQQGDMRDRIHITTVNALDYDGWVSAYEQDALFTSYLIAQPLLRKLLARAKAILSTAFLVGDVSLAMWIFRGSIRFTIWPANQTTEVLEQIRNNEQMFEDLCRRLEYGTLDVYEKTLRCEAVYC